MEEKNKRSFSKIGYGAIAIAAVIIIAMVALVGTNTIKTGINKVPTAEELRAMTYDKVQAGEDLVEGTNEHVKFDAFALRDLDGDGYAESYRRSLQENRGNRNALYGNKCANRRVLKGCENNNRWKELFLSNNASRR